MNTYILCNNKLEPNLIYIQKIMIMIMYFTVIIR